LGRDIRESFGPDKPRSNPLGRDCTQIVGHFHVATGSTPDLYGHGRTDAKGRFLLRGLSPGEYTVVVLADFEEDLRQPEVMKKI
jgi:hypothetical protein